MHTSFPNGLESLGAGYAEVLGTSLSYSRFSIYIVSFFPPSHSARSKNMYKMGTKEDKGITTRVMVIKWLSC